MKDTLYIVIPCFNEESVLPVTSKMFLEKLEALILDGLVSGNSKILFVNDGSTDETWNIIKKLCEENPCFTGISQSRNFGHQSAVLAGMTEAKEYADMVITMDCDGQDDINAVDEMLAKYYAGADIVYGVRRDRSSDSVFKRKTAEAFYDVMSMLGAKTIKNHADYRLISRRVLEALGDFEEVNLFLRGIVPLAGYKSDCVYYSRQSRLAGESHYPFRKMAGLAIDGITSFSVKPLYFIFPIGLTVSAASLVCFIVSLCKKSTLMTACSAVCFVLGISIMCLGVLAVYAGKAYMEVKHRPRYIISERTWE